MKTHYKKLYNPNYLGAYSLQPGQEVTVTIDKIVQEMVTGEKGRKDECVVVYFKEKVNGEDKPMILNITNSKRIESVHGTAYVEEWIGKRIIIHSEVVDFKGDKVESLRVKPELPEAPPTQDEIDDIVAQVGYCENEKDLTKLWKELNPKFHKVQEVVDNFKARKDELA